MDIVSVSRYMVVGGEPVAVVPPGSPPYRSPTTIPGVPVLFHVPWAGITSCTAGVNFHYSRAITP